MFKQKSKEWLCVEGQYMWQIASTLIHGYCAWYRDGRDLFKDEHPKLEEFNHRFGVDLLAIFDNHENLYETQADIRTMYKNGWWAIGMDEYALEDYLFYLGQMGTAIEAIKGFFEGMSNVECRDEMLNEFRSWDMNFDGLFDWES